MSRQIRPFADRDMDQIIDIWYRASIRAHTFVPREFWQRAKSDMRRVYIPNAETWTLEDRGRVVGFLCLCDQILAAIFVDPELQRSGYGTQLLQHALALRTALELNVYGENTAAIAFYKQHGFAVEREQICEHTGAKELHMTWKRR